MACRGLRSYGLDANVSMLEYAKSKLSPTSPPVHLLEADVTRFTLPVQPCCLLLRLPVQPYSAAPPGSGLAARRCDHA